MRIKKLELQGFKSFVDPTVIDFDLPIVAIVGPNGCGKSNIVDAIRWVMGEQSAKHLRGKAMEDVIFGGSANRAPLGMCSITLTFSTDDGIVPPHYSGFSEISITRRLFRSGESEYLINKVPCRLRDILDLFLGTGAGTKAYSIVAQGQVDFAINAKPEDRRRLIEEAAGISKFKARRDTALRRMESTQNNLLRLGDILAEIRRQIRSLERQVKRAERYHRYLDQLRQLELHVSSIKFLEQKREQSEMLELLAQWAEKEAVASGALSSVEATLDKERLELTSIETELAHYQEKIFEISNRLQLARAQKDYKEKESTSLDEQSERWRQECHDANNKLCLVLDELIAKEQEAGSIDLMTRQVKEAFDAAESDWQKASHKRHEKISSLEACREGQIALSQNLATLESQLTSIKQYLPNLKNRLDRTEDEKENIRSQQKKQGQAIAQSEVDLRELLDQQNAVQRRRIELDQKISDGNTNREARQEELTNLQEELVNKRSRLRSLIELEKSLEGYGEGVRSILKGAHREGIHGLVADRIDFEPEYEAALLAALGEKLQYVIVESQREGIESINFLKREVAGRCSFLPKGIRTPEATAFSEEGHGVLGPLSNFVQLKGEFAPLSEYLFDNVLLVENLEKAIELWENQQTTKRLVTLEGDLIDPSGTLTGGRSKQGSNNILAKRREIGDLRRDVIRLEQEIGLKEDFISQLEGSLSGIVLEHKALEQEWQSLEVNKAKLEQDLSHQKEAERRLSLQMAALQEALREVSEEISANRFTQEELQLKQEEDQKKEAEEQARLKKLQQELSQAEEVFAARRETLTEAKIRMSSVEEKAQGYHSDLERLRGMKADLQHRIAARTEEITHATEKIKTLKKDITQLEEQIVREEEACDDLKKQQAEKQEVFNKKRTTLQEDEIKLRDLRRSLDSAREHNSDLKISLTRLEGEINHLISQISEKYSLCLEDIANEWREKTPSCEDPIARIEELREKLENIGPVNLEAIPEFENLKERESFLSKQFTDLQEAIENLQKVIRKMNQTTRKRFEETFKQVQEKFTQVFPRLFKGGRAELRLENPNDLLNTGVLLMVQPPGKRLSHISLLSGGEKALSAVAFIFSIFFVKPSPFCILDEVDAPLDDVNTGRFHRLIEGMIDRTQFILITHNKLTMEMASGLYGVTMEEAGVSKVVSVRLDDVKEMPQVASA